MADVTGEFILDHLQSIGLILLSKYSNNCGVQIPSYWMKMRKQNSPSLDKTKGLSNEGIQNGPSISYCCMKIKWQNFFSYLLPPPQIESSHLPFASLNVLIIEKSAMETPNLGEVLDTCKGNSNWSPATGLFAPYCKFQDILTASLQWTICSPFNQNVQRDQGISGENFCCNG